jgi:hypothetical protein
MISLDLLMTIFKAQDGCIVKRDGIAMQPSAV